MEAMTLDRAAAWWAEESKTPRPHRSTLARWTMKGVNGIRLQAQRRGGRWFVTPDALREFHRLINSDTCPTPRMAGEVRAAEITAAHSKLDEKLRRGRGKCRA